jgi:hypothetical protein
VKEEDKALFEQAFDKAAELILEKISWKFWEMIF